jgi:predicted ATPase
MRVSLEDHKAMGAEMDVPYYLTLQADLLFHMGRVDESIATLERAFAANPPGRAFFFEAEMHRLHARLVLARQPGDTERAGALLDRALAVARAQSARMLELRACMTRLELGIDQNGAARKALARALDSLEEVGSSPEGQAARALLGAAQKKRPARTASRRPV